MTTGRQYGPSSEGDRTNRFTRSIDRSATSARWLVRQAVRLLRSRPLRQRSCSVLPGLRRALRTRRTSTYVCRSSRRRSSAHQRFPTPNYELPARTVDPAAHALFVTWFSPARSHAALFTTIAWRRLRSTLPSGARYLLESWRT